jgi:ferric-dicitrate binding protein FerR (iron transport regulator)
VESTRVFVLHRTPKALDTEDEAAAWLVRLDAEPSAATLASWQQWLHEDIAHRAAFVRVEKGWRRSERLKSLRSLDGAVKLDLMDGFPGVGPASRWVRAARQAPYTTLAVALGAGALASLLVLAGWHFFTRLDPDAFGTAVIQLEAAPPAGANH